MFIPEFRKPSANCASLVKEYVFMYASSDEDSYADKYIPDGYGAIVVNFKSTVFVSDEQHRERMPDVFFIPVVSKSKLIEVNAPFDTIVIFVKVSVLSALFGIDFMKLSDKLVQTMEIFTGFPDLKELGGLSSIEKRLEKLEEILLLIPGLNNYKPDKIDSTYEFIIRNGGLMPVKQILADFNMQSRSFRRHFQQRVGLNAKTLSRIVRFNHVWMQVDKSRTLDFWDLVTDGGFFDQSHLINDFKKIIGETPRRFFSRNLEQVLFISAKPALTKKHAIHSCSSHIPRQPQI